MALPESSSVTLEDKAISADGILDILSDEGEGEGEEKDGKEKPAKESKKEGKEESEVEKEHEGEETEVEEKIEIEEKDDDELQFLHVNRREILKAYPDLFKKFPSIEKSIYREQQYAQIFPTMQEARESKEAVDNYARFESSLLDGDISDVLSTVKNSDNNAFEKITETFLPTLSKIDKTAHAAILSQVLKGAAISMFTEGKNRENENLQLAAQILHEFAFGNGTITTYQFKHKPGEVTEDPKEKQLVEREQSFIKQQLNVAIDDVSTKAENIIKSTIDKHIDPKNSMSEYVRDNAAREIMNEVDLAIKSDKNFVAVLDRMWERSFNEDFAESSKIKIKNALLSKAQTVLPDIIRKVRAKALKGNTIRHEREDREDREEKEVNKPLEKRNLAGSSGKKSSDGRGMRTSDFFMQD